VRARLIASWAPSLKSPMPCAEISASVVVYRGLSTSEGVTTEWQTRHRPRPHAEVSLATLPAVWVVWDRGGELGELPQKRGGRSGDAGLYVQGERGEWD
jgi:hypothetical protein